MNKDNKSMTYILLIFLLLIICIFLFLNQFALKHDLHIAQKECGFNQKQIEMIYYVAENAEGIKKYSDRILVDSSVLVDYDEMKENGLEHFMKKDNDDTLTPQNSISIINESTVYYVYSYDGLETNEHQIYSFYYIPEICDENRIYIEECVRITDNIYIKPYEIFCAGLV